MSHHTGDSDPLHRRPDVPSLEQLHSREHWRAVAGAHRADAELVAKALGIGEGAVA